MTSSGSGPGSGRRPEPEHDHVVEEELARVRVRLAERVAAGPPGDDARYGVDRTVEALEELITTLVSVTKAAAGVLLLTDGRDLVPAARAPDTGLPPRAAGLPPHHPLVARLPDDGPLTVTDLREEPELGEVTGELGLGDARALCGALMRTVEDETVGAILLGFSAPRGFRARDLLLVRGFARQGAEIVERARLHAEARTLAERERHLGERLRMLADTALAVSGERDVEEILRMVAQAACRIVGTRQGVARRLTTEQSRTRPERHGLADAPDQGPVPDSLAAPLVARDGSNLGLVQVSGRVDGAPFSEDDEAILVQLAQMASVSIENAELIQRERDARREAEESARIRGVLSDASAAFAASLDLEEVLAAVTSIVVPEFADWCGISLLRSDGEIQLVAESAADEVLARAVAGLRERMRPSLDLPHGVGAVIRTGKSEFFPAVPPEVLREMALSAGVEPSLLYGLSIESGLVVPLPARGRTLGAITLIRSATAVAYNERELAFAEDLAARAALAIENATRFTLERQAADMLQRSLLPQALPHLPGVQSAARYLPGGAGMRIGGDWYDVIALEPHRMAFVVGDVMGRGIAAATVMGQLRAAVRAYALEGHGPAQVLDLVDRLVERMDDLQLTTCVYGVYDARDATFTVACAGHPPPLLLHPGGQARFLDLPAGLPLGTAMFATEPRAESVVTLPQGSTLLLYTDGLIEARDCPVDEGMARLREATTGGGDDPEALCDMLLKAMGRDGHHDDDTALLALAVTSRESRPPAPPLPEAGRRLASDLRSPGAARRLVRERLDSWGLPEVDAVVLVAHELVTNAVLHGEDPIALRLDRREGAVRIEVADGSEVPPSLRHYEADSFTGRGLALVEALARRWGWQLAGHGKVVWCEVPL